MVCCTALQSGNIYWQKRFRSKVLYFLFIYFSDNSSAHSYLIATLSNKWPIRCLMSVCLLYGKIRIGQTLLRQQTIRCQLLIRDYWIFRSLFDDSVVRCSLGGLNVIYRLHGPISRIDINILLITFCGPTLFQVCKALHIINENLMRRQALIFKSF